MAVAPILNTKSLKPIVNQSSAYYFLINEVEVIDGHVSAKLLGYEVLECKSDIKEVISKYLPLKEKCELCIYTCDERFIKRFVALDNPSIEDVLNEINIL